MVFISSVVQETIKLRNALRSKKVQYGSGLQEKALRKLLEKAKATAFGRTYDFQDLLKSKYMVEAFQSAVPVHDYYSMYDKWWSKCLLDQEDICWPGKIKYFGLTSGTTDSASKRVPVSADMIKSIVKAGANQYVNVSYATLPKEILDKDVLMLGGSTSLTAVGEHFEGDLSGILAKKLPAWFTAFYKPGKKIASEKNWTKKLEMIVEKAPDWDVGIVAGVPAWVQLLFEQLIGHYQVKNVHDIWPNLKFYVHGGVSFEPYREGFNKFLGEELYTLDSYLASEGFMAYQTGVDRKGMQLVLNNGIFFEFIAFTEENFTPDGDLKSHVELLLVDEVEEGVDYAIVISTNAGTWRYLIGDVVRFTDLGNYEIIIQGRTKCFLSLCGEHLSVGNMNDAIKTVSLELGLSTKEFTVAGVKYESMFAHKWYIGYEQQADAHQVKVLLDQTLCQLNDDYKTERIAALKDVIVELIPNTLFYEYMETQGRFGGQSKFSRVLKGEALDKWASFLQEKGALGNGIGDCASS